MMDLRHGVTEHVYIAIVSCITFDSAFVLCTGASRMVYIYDVGSCTESSDEGHPDDRPEQVPARPNPRMSSFSTCASASAAGLKGPLNLGEGNYDVGSPGVHHGM